MTTYTELLKLASNDSGDTSDDKPPGVRIGGINIDGKSAGPVREGNAVKIVLPRDTPDFLRTWELLAKQLPLLCLALLCLSGCLTAAKISAWQREVYGWGTDASATKPCQAASAEASAYLANANQRLAEAGKLTDLASDGQAKQLVTSAALACGRRMP